MVILWLCLIFCLSAQPAVDSKELSSNTTLWLIQGMEIIFPEWNIQSTDIHGPLRKMAHFLLYFVLGLLFTWSMYIEKGNKNKKAMIAITFCFFYALTDEFHQAFVPGRGAQWSDVAIDSLGSIFGVGLQWMIQHLHIVGKKQI
jgi:VanZ family protein